MSVKEKKLSQEVVKSLFEYRDGCLYWKVDMLRRKCKGQLAGGIMVNGYYKVSFNGCQYLLHRIIYFLHNGIFPENIDHIDRDISNNKIENLRSVTKQQNSFNCSKTKSKTHSKYIGVTWKKCLNPWIAVIKINGQPTHLGYFSTEIEAAVAYNNAAKETRGEFANINVIDYM